MLPFSHTLIEMLVADRKHGDTLFRQKARFVSLLHTQAADGVSQASIVVEVTLYAAEGEGCGQALTGPGLNPYMVTLNAANNTLIDATTGDIVTMRDPNETNLGWQTRIKKIAGNTMLQGDFFEMLRDNQPVNIGDMIRHHIQQANKMGRFNA